MDAATLPEPVEGQDVAPDDGIAIVVLTHNRVHLLQKCVENVLFRTSDATREIVIWDNASTDATREYLESLDDPRIRVVLSEKNIGQNAYARAFRLTTSPYLIELDDDVVDAPAGWDAVMLDAFKQLPDVGFLAADLEDDPHDLASRYRHHIRPHEYTLVEKSGVRLLRGPAGGGCAMTSRELNERVGGFREDKKQVFWLEDEAYIGDIAKLGFGSAVLADLRVHHTGRPVLHGGVAGEGGVLEAVQSEACPQDSGQAHPLPHPALSPAEWALSVVRSAILNEEELDSAGGTRVRRVLIHSYHFPPTGGSGTQRPARMVRHLPDYGYEPVVVTAPGPPRSAGLPSTTRSIRRCRPISSCDGCRGPSRPRPRGGDIASSVGCGFRDPWTRSWIEGSTRLGIETAREADVDLIYAWMSALRVCGGGLATQQRVGKPWVADLGDPWALDEMMVYPTGLHRRREFVGCADCSVPPRQ